MGGFPPPQKRRAASAGTAPGNYATPPDIDTSSTGDDFLPWGIEVVNFDSTNPLYISFDGTTDDIVLAAGERMVRDHFAAPDLQIWFRGGVVYTGEVWA